MEYTHIMTSENIIISKLFKLYTLFYQFSGKPIKLKKIDEIKVINN